MKKLLLYFVKFVNNFTNDKLTAEQEAESILTYLLWKSSVSHTLEVNEAIQRQLKNKMLLIKEEYSSVIVKIDKTYSPEPLKIVHQLNETQ
ncbi:MAG: hypothetical protein V4666_08510 [Bacteroidota bacterium]